jgi:hypothetical protein
MPDYLNYEENSMIKRISNILSDLRRHPPLFLSLQSSLPFPLLVTLLSDYLYYLIF